MTVAKSGPLDTETNAELAYFVTVFSLVGTIVLILFGALQIAFEHNTMLGVLEIAGGIAIGLNVLAFRLTKNVIITRNLFLAAAITFLLLMLITGGIKNTGIFWYFIFPVAAFFLAGRIGGILWITVLYTATISLLVLSQLELIVIAYTPIGVRQLLISLFVVSFAIYVYQRVRETAHFASTQSKRALQAERSRAETIVDTIGEGIIAVDQEQNITFVNRSLGALLGVNPNDLLGQNIAKALALTSDNGAKLDGLDHPLARVLRSGKHNITTATLTKAGDKKIFTVSCAPIINEGAVVGVAASVRDVTQERAIDRAKSEFVTIASHQLRTPISAISWFAEMLLSGDAGKLTKEQYDDIERIHQSSTRMARLVSEMLIVSSLDLGNLPVRPVPTNIGALAHSIVKDHLAFIDDKHAPKVKEQYDKNLPEVPVDQEIIKSILHHTIVNSIKYTPPRGNVSLEIMKDDHKLNPTSKGSVVIIVSDNGYGIPKEAQAKIFTKFFRASNIKDKDTDGTGLGLFIVKSLLDYTGGAISFTSEESHGSTFIVRIPLEGMQPKS